MCESCNNTKPVCQYISQDSKEIEISLEENNSLCNRLNELAGDSIYLFIHIYDSLPPSTEIIHITDQILAQNQAFNSDWLILFIAEDHKSYYIHFCNHYKEDIYMKERSTLKKYVFDNLSNKSYDLFSGFIEMVDVTLSNRL